MQDSVWVIYRREQVIGVAASKIDAIRYLIEAGWMGLDRKEIGYLDNKGYIFLTPREAAKQANTTVEEILEKALENNHSPYFIRYNFIIQEEQIICGYDTPVE